MTNALGNVTTFTYDGNGNLVSKTNPDGYTTEYTYNALDLVTSINYNITNNHPHGGKSMRFRDERKVFKEILNYPTATISTLFSVRDDGTCYTFIEKAQPSHYVTVDKTKGDSFWVPVNADFGFNRPAGSNNYRELIDVARHLVNAFGLNLNW